MRGSRASRLALLTAVGTVGTALLWAPSAHADVSYDAQAKADGVDITYYNPSLPLGLTAEAAGPTASSHLNTVGVSDAFAAFPYPGDTVAGLPGLAGALFGNLPTPSYPFIVTSDLGEAPQEQDLGPVTLKADSGVSENDASAVVASGTTGDQATSRVEELSDGSVSATADTSINALKLADQLTVSGVQAHVQAVADAYSGNVTRTSTLSIGRIEIPGLALPLPATTPSTVPIPNPIGALPQLPPVTGLPELPVPFGGTTLADPDIGFENGQLTVTLPVSGGMEAFALPTGPVLSAFKAAGVTMTYQAATNTTTGIEGATVTFSTELPAPPSNPIYHGASDVSYVIGRGNANVDLSPDLSSYSDPTLGTVSDVGSSGSLPLSGTTVAPARPGSAVKPSTVATSSVPGGSPNPVPTGSTTAPLAVAAPSVGVVTPSQGSAVQVASGSPDGTAVVAAKPPGAGGTALAASDAASPLASVNDIYLLFVCVAGLSFAAATGLRILGVRLRWRS